MQNKTTIYTAQQNKSLAKLLSEAKQEGRTNKVTPLNRLTMILERFVVPSLFFVLLVSVVGLFVYMMYVDLIK